MKRNKAERRKHKFRIKKKFLNKIKQDNTLYFYLNKDKLKRYINKWADIQCMCSCNMCCNPRHSKLYKGENKLTIQERKALLNYYEEMKELNAA